LSRREEAQLLAQTQESWMKLEEELRDLHELITTFSATPAVTVFIGIREAYRNPEVIRSYFRPFPPVFSAKHLSISLKTLPR
jgi:hypothetical protein